jgi:uncharacterized protein involved in exopolysaccharide biosynthesis
MTDLFIIIRNWWKHCLVLVLLAMIIAYIICMMQARQYLSVATALPASSLGNDKARVFNSNIQALYSSLGTTDELDMLVGTGQLDTIYLAVTDEYNLQDHYKMKEEGDAARTKAALSLKKNTHVLRSDYNELKVKVWDTDKHLAAQLANALMVRLQSIHSALQNMSNEATINALDLNVKKAKQSIDSIGSFLANADITAAAAKEFTDRRESLMAQIHQYENLRAEYQLIIDTKTSALLVVENARPAQYADRPNTPMILMITGFLALLFAFFTAAILESNKTKLRAVAP